MSISKVTWKRVTAHEHASPVQSRKVTVYREVEAKTSADRLGALFGSSSGGGGGGSDGGSVDVGHTATSVKYELLSPPVTLHDVNADPEKPNPKVGIGLVGFSADSRYE